ncbi:B3/B4 domain-containing protein (DNA/RNA-binding domain of Phe-tRNA-synthetase) [Nocardioides terrae]|uniref:B3/B4 domain-containing protein (DNA/RNA-binding domain of Phe-tRNA-synthetase) n=1 Tax=Nocardioides terrae TaxID=574651 RepID=A0A1I1KTD3_9ACTN|nr:B3/B4 domain-containing protein (DNA/RNA-binding domain of Phe-tRNA-synthetase) [Nocardioides terrae]
MTDLDAFLAGASVDDAVAALRPDYRAFLIAVDGLPASFSGASNASDSTVEGLLVRAERSAAELLATTPVEETSHVAAWREAYRAFGAKPQRTRNSLEALLRRVGVAGSGLPRVNPLTDIYNAMSVLHEVPIGGEDLNAYAGTPRLVRATGTEPFDTLADGKPTIEHPDVGEVVWCDDAGVTCRRWNWRQGRRTQLSPHTTAALFILDALAPITDDAAAAAGDELVAHLRRLGSGVRVARRLIPTTPTTTGTAAQETRA